MGKKGKGKKLLGKISKGVNDLVHKGEKLMNGSDSDDDQPETTEESPENVASAEAVEKSGEGAASEVQSVEEVLAAPEVMPSNVDTMGEEAVSTDLGVQVTENTESPAPAVASDTVTLETTPESAFVEAVTPDSQGRPEAVVEEPAETIPDVIVDTVTVEPVSESVEEPVTPATASEQVGAEEPVEQALDAQPSAADVVLEPAETSTAAVVVEEPVEPVEPAPVSEPAPEVVPKQEQATDTSMPSTDNEVDRQQPQEQVRQEEEKLARPQPEIHVEHPDDSTKRKGFLSALFCW